MWPPVIFLQRLLGAFSTCYVFCCCPVPCQIHRWLGYNGAVLSAAPLAVWQYWFNIFYQSKTYVHIVWYHIFLGWNTLKTHNAPLNEQRIVNWIKDIMHSLELPRLPRNPWSSSKWISIDLKTFQAFQRLELKNRQKIVVVSSFDSTIMNWGWILLMEEILHHLGSIKPRE